MLPTQALIGRQFANFRIVRLLGRGGMAEVYFGWDVKLERPVAIKVIDARYRDDPVYAQRFVNEARAMAAWHHPNITQIYYADDEAGYYYYVMEYIHGLDLEQVLDEYSSRQALMPLEDVVRVGRAAAEALDYAHRNGVVHRDVKPSNLLISADGRIVLSDFGLAMNVQQGSIGTVFGSPHYIAPEQARHSSEAIPQSDLYALGVILYELLTGTVPFDDPSPTALALQHLTLEPPSPRQFNPLLSPAVEVILLKALRKSPAERYQSGKALMDALEAALFTTAQTAPFLPTAAPAVEAARPPLRTISRLGLAQVVALHLAKSATEWEQTPQISRPQVTPGSRFKLHAWWIAGCAALLVLGLGIFLVTALIVKGSQGVAQGARSTSTQPVQGALLKTPVQTASVQNPGGVQNPMPTQPVSATQAPPPVDATQPPDSPTETSPPETTSPPAGNPAGDLFAMYYDDTSFYIKNLSGNDRSIYPLAFERLDKKGNPSSRFDGWHWGEIYPKFRSGYCMVVEILDFTRHLNPPECKNLYLVTRTPTADQPYIFWTKYKDSQEFRVLWNKVEVGRCKIGKKTCEVYLP